MLWQALQDSFTRRFKGAVDVGNDSSIALQRPAPIQFSINFFLGLRFDVTRYSYKQEEAINYRNNM